MTVVYLDKVFLINALVDYLLLLTTLRLSGEAIYRPRLILCAVCGGLYAVMVFLPGAALLSHPACRLAAGIALAAAAFRRLSRPVRLVALFLFLSCGLGGALLAVGLAAGATYDQVYTTIYHARFNMWLLLLSAAGAVILLQLVFRQGARHGGGEIMKITVAVGGKLQSVQALRDTGNTLRDPIHARPVLVVEQSALLQLWDPEIRAILQKKIPPEEKMTLLYRYGAGTPFSLLPFRSVGVSSGLLLAVRSEYISIGDYTYPKTLVALSTGPLSDGGCYQALWGGETKGGEHASIANSVSMDHQTQQAG